MEDIDIVRWAESPVGFYVDRWYDCETGRWVQEDRPIKLADYHADLLRHLFTPDDGGRLPYDVIAWCEPAKSGKSAIAGLVAQYIGLHGEQNSQVIMAGNKRDQAASIMYASFADSIRMNPALDLGGGRYQTDLPNGNTVRAIPSNSKGEAGARFSLALFDELWAYVYEDAQRLWSEFKTDPTRQNSVKMAVGYGGYIGEGALWLKLLETGTKRGDPVAELSHITNGDEPACWANGRTFVFWSHETRQPWQTQAWIESQRRTLRASEFQRMIRCEFAEPVGDFVDQADWEALIDPDHKPLEAGSQHTVYIGLDLAVSAGGDDCALVGVYQEDGRVKVAFHKLWKGKDRKARLKLGETVKPHLLDLMKRYNIGGLYFDPWQAQFLADELRDAGLWVMEVPQTHATRGPKDTGLYTLVCDQRLVLYDHPDLKWAAAGANAQALPNGQLFLKKSSGRSKIDLLVALANVADVAMRPAPWYIW